VAFASTVGAQTGARAMAGDVVDVAHASTYTGTVAPVGVIVVVNANAGTAGMLTPELTKLVEFAFGSVVNWNLNLCIGLPRVSDLEMVQRDSTLENWTIRLMECNGTSAVLPIPVAAVVAVAPEPAAELVVAIGLLFSCVRQPPQTAWFAYNSSDGTETPLYLQRKADKACQRSALLQQIPRPARMESIPLSNTLYRSLPHGALSQTSKYHLYDHESCQRHLAALFR
jgi:hypothetical protein